MEIRTPREESPDASIYDSAFSEVKSFTRSSRWRYVPCAILFSTGAYLTTSLWSGLQSTYICPIVNGQGRTIPLLQLAAMILDAFLVCVSFELSLPGSQSGLNIRGQGPLTWILLLGVRSDTAGGKCLLIMVLGNHDFLDHRRRCTLLRKAGVSRLADCCVWPFWPDLVESCNMAGFINFCVVGVSGTFSEFLGLISRPY